MRTPTILALAVLGFLMSAAACGRSATTTKTNAPGTSGNGNPSPTTVNTSTTTNANTNVNSSRTVTTGGSQVTISRSGFSPATLTVTKGTTVTFTNADTVSHWVASNPHPVHTDYSGFDLGNQAGGASKTFTFDRVGTWGYHDHLDATTATLRGTIVVTQ